MGSNAYYICDKCGTKLLLNLRQPSHGMFGKFLQKYCPATRRVIWITLSSVFDGEKVIISCQEDIAKPPKMPQIRTYFPKYRWLKSMIQWMIERFFIWKCKKRKCNGSCLEDLQILKKNTISQNAEQYKCPRHGCDGIMHIEPSGIYSNWD